MDKTSIDSLIAIVGRDNVLTTPEDLAVYSYDGTFAETKPEIVVQPGSTEEVSQVVALAAKLRLPIIARGMGSGLAAGSIPLVPGGLVLSLTRMNRILEIDPVNATVHVEAGIITADLQADVEKMFWVPGKVFLSGRQATSSKPEMSKPQFRMGKCRFVSLSSSRNSGLLEAVASS